MATTNQEKKRLRHEADTLIFDTCDRRQLAKEREGCSHLILPPPMSKDFSLRTPRLIFLAVANRMIVAPMRA